MFYIIFSKNKYLFKDYNVYHINIRYSINNGTCNTIRYLRSINK